MEIADKGVSECTLKYALSKLNKNEIIQFIDICFLKGDKSENFIKCFANNMYSVNRLIVI